MPCRSERSYYAWIMNCRVLVSVMPMITSCQKRFSDVEFVFEVCCLLEVTTCNEMQVISMLFVAAQTQTTNVISAACSCGGATFTTSNAPHCTTHHKPHIFSSLPLNITDYQPNITHTHELKNTPAKHPKPWHNRLLAHEAMSSPRPLSPASFVEAYLRTPHHKSKPHRKR
jgi:hypothetical protein